MSTKASASMLVVVKASKHSYLPMRIWGLTCFKAWAFKLRSRILYDFGKEKHYFFETTKNLIISAYTTYDSRGLVWGDQKRTVDKPESSPQPGYAPLSAGSTVVAGARRTW